VRAILANPRYTGYQVWNKQRRDEILLDVNDVAAGYETKLRWNDPDDWVWSTQPAHPAIITLDTWKQAQRHLNLGQARQGQRRDRPTARPYVLRGLIRCGLCGRKMQGTWNHDSAHYRCQYAAEYAQLNDIDHPKTVYLREDAVMPKLDGWLAEVFDPANIDATCQAMADAQGHDETAARASAARARIADCDRRLANYRKTLDMGGPTSTIVAWMAEVDAERLAAEQELGTTIPKAPLTRSQIKAIVFSLTDHLRMLAQADPATKAELYANLGLRLTYHPDRQTVAVEAELSGVDKSVSKGRLQPQVHGPPGRAPSWPREHTASYSTCATVGPWEPRSDFDSYARMPPSSSAASRQARRSTSRSPGASPRASCPQRRSNGNTGPR